MATTTDPTTDPAPPPRTISAMLAAAGGLIVITPPTPAPVRWDAWDWCWGTRSGAPPATGSFGKVRRAEEQYHPHGQATAAWMLRAVEAELGLADKSLNWYPDGYCFRNGKVGGEAAHRDAAPPGIYASWVASTESRFTYVPGSSTSRGTVGGLDGVAPGAYPEDAWTTAVIPAGSIVVFDPTLAHRVAAVNYTRTPQHRFFCGISTEPPSDALVKAIKTGAYPNAPSGEVQTAYPRLWFLNWPNKAIVAARDLEPHEVETRTVSASMKPGTRSRIAAALGVPSVECGDTYVVPKRHPQPVPPERLLDLDAEIQTALELVGGPALPPDHTLKFYLAWMLGNGHARCAEIADDPALTVEGLKALLLSGNADSDADSDADATATADLDAGRKRARARSCSAGDDGPAPIRPRV